MGVLKKIYQTILYIYCQIIIFYCCAHPYLTINDNYVLPFLLIGIVLLSFYKIIYKSKAGKNNFLIYILLFCICLSIIYNDFNDIVVYFRLVFSILFSILVISTLNFKKIAFHFIKIMNIVCVVSIFGYIFINLLGLIELPTFININNSTYGNGFIYFYIEGIKNRNCGIFWEPGVFATFVLFDLILNYILFNNKFKYNIIILLITMITINSSAGYLLSVFYLFLLIYNRIRDKKDTFNTLVKFLFIPLVIVALYVFYYSISLGNLSNNQFFAKLQYDNFMTSYRIKALSFNFDVLKDNILFGCGINEYYSIAPKLLCPDTSTSTLFLALFGIFGSLYTIIIICNFFKIKKISIIEKIILLVIILSIVNKEPHLNMAFSWMLILGINLGDKNKNESY